MTHETPDRGIAGRGVLTDRQCFDLYNFFEKEIFMLNDVTHSNIPVANNTALPRS
jgi:hypothetical protein